MANPDTAVSLSSKAVTAASKAALAVHSVPSTPLVYATMMAATTAFALASTSSSATRTAPKPTRLTARLVSSTSIRTRTMWVKPVFRRRQARAPLLCSRTGGHAHALAAEDVSAALPEPAGATRACRRYASRTHRWGKRALQPSRKRFTLHTSHRSERATWRLLLGVDASLR